jgi:hypothetical protein
MIAKDLDIHLHCFSDIQGSCSKTPCVYYLSESQMACAPTKHPSSAAAVSMAIDANSGWSSGFVLPKAMT